MLSNTTPLTEIVLRVLIIYAALIVLLRLAGKREIGQLGPLDLLGMLILSETVSPALTREDDSLPAALTAAATLIVITAVISRLTFRFPTLERLLEGAPREVIKDGHIDEAVLRAERISQHELGAALREAGVRSPADVERATLEPTGRITVVERPKSGR